MMKNTLRTILLTCLLTLLMCLPGCIEWNTGNEFQQNTVTIEGKGTFTSIQRAIENATEGDILHVGRGIYNETLIIETPITLIGENAANTIIASSDTSYDYRHVLIYANNCVIDGFTIESQSKPINNQGISVQSSNNTLTNLTISDYTYGIYFASKSENNILSHNNLSGNYYAIYLSQADHNNIINNNITGNSHYGIYISSGNSNYIANNLITNTGNGSRIKGARDNRITRNVFSHNYRALYFCCSAKDNIVYYNAFIDNKIQADDSIGNQWDLDTLGNYWDDYNGTDADNDGIGDTPYIIHYYQRIQDNYPLMNRPSDL
jgi:nitrous oxidase accessory protein